jgi:hypothetical protein
VKEKSLKNGFFYTLIKISMKDKETTAAVGITVLSFKSNKNNINKRKIESPLLIKNNNIIRIASQNLRKGTNLKIAQITNTLKTLEIDILLAQEWSG